MDLFSALSRRLGIGASKKSVGGPNDYGGTWLPLGGAQGDRINNANLLEANREWVFLAVDKNATTLAGVRFKVMRYQNTSDDQEVFNGPLVDFLESPAEGLTGKDFIYLNTAYKELTGNAFWEKVGGRKVAPLVSTRVVPILEKGALAGIKYSDPAGMQRTLLLKDVLHDRNPDLARPWWGAGKLQKIARWADTSSFATEFLERFFVNGASFGGFIETEEESEQRIKLIKIGLHNDHQGVQNAHKWGILPKGSKATVAGTKMADMEMGATDDRYRDKILAAFGVPKTLVGLTTEVNRASAESSEYVYAKYTVKPLADDLTEFLNTKVAPMLDASGKFYFAYDDFIPEDIGNKVIERQAALGNQAYMTINEVRAEQGLPPVEGGDVVYAMPNLIPLGTPPPAPVIVAPAANDNEEPAQDPKDPSEDPKEPKKAMPARARAAFSRELMIDGIAKRALAVLTSHHDPDAEAHKDFVGRVESHERLVADKVRDFNNRQERDVAQRLKHIAKGVQKGDMFDMDGEVTVLVDLVGPILKGLMLEQAIAEYEAQEFPGQLDQAQPRLRAIVDIAAQRMAKSYNKTTATLLAKTLNDGIGNGEDLTQLTDRVRQIYDFSNQVRAKSVAHTEAFYIANEGNREAYKQSGVVTSMRWYTAEDDKVCEFCGPEDGVVIGLDDNFHDQGTTLTGSEGGTLDLDYRDIDVPPLHPNCRCFVRPESIAVNG